VSNYLAKKFIQCVSLFPLYQLKLKRKKKIDIKPRPNIHRTTIKHNNEIVFTCKSIITTFSKQQKEIKTNHNNILKTTKRDKNKA